jgi:uncharacterized protein DUF937
MAVSQYLRPGSLLDSLTSCFTPGAVKGASLLIGASEWPTRVALRTAAPAVLGGMAGMASTNEGAKSLFSIIQNGGYDALAEDPASLFAGGNMTSSMVGVGRQMADRLFEERGASVIEAVANASGLSQAPAGTLLNLVVPLAMGVVEKEITYRGLDASNLRDLLLDQKGDFTAAMPPKGPQVVPPRPEVAVQQRESNFESNLSKWLAAWLIVLLAFCAFLWMRSGTVEGGAPPANPAAQGTAAPDSR